MDSSEFAHSQRIVYLVTRFIDGSIDFAELQELNAWRKESDANERLFANSIDREKQQQAVARMQSYDTAGSLLRLKENIHRAKKERARIARIWRLLLAAGIITLCLSITIFYFFYDKNKQPLDAAVPKIQKVTPGSDKALLTLADGRRIALQNHANGVIAVQAGSQVMAGGPGKLTYQGETASTNGMTTYNTISTPKGGKYQLQLPDGTEVWLNAASSLHYPVSFKGKSREVELTGEAYFEVAKDKTRPFTVVSAGQKVTVLGTHFNINSYSDEPQTVTTLLEGSVKVTTGQHQVLLLPGQQSALKEDKINVSKADIYVATAWKNGKMAFLRTDVRNVLRQLARWYDIDIVYKGNIPDFTVSGDVSRDADLSAMIRILELYDVHCKLQDRKLIISN